MSTTEDTSAIDDKKTEDTGGTAPDFVGFTTNYLSSIVFTIGVSIFIIGGLGLYTTKVAQSNILPDNIELAPYTIIDRVVENIPIDINVMRPTFWSENKDTVSQKAIFDSQGYLDSFSNSFICSLKDKASAKGGSNAALFFSRVYDNIVAKNLLAINTIFFYLSYLPESMIMLLYGFLGIFIWMALYFFNMCISIFYHIVNIPELFRATFNPDETKKDIFEWESDETLSYFRFFKFLLFFFIWIPVGMFSAFVVPAFFTLYGLISPLLASYTINKTKKSYGVYDFIKDTFAYKKFFFFVLATLSLFSNGIKYLGTNSIIGIIVAVVFAYFMGLYTNEMPDVGSDGFTSKIRENLKQAKIVPIDDTKLVEICPQIVIDDDKLKKIIKTGTFRKVTKPKETGGDIDANVDNTPVPSAPPIEQMAPTPSAPPISNLQEQLKTYQDRLDFLNDDLGKGAIGGPEIMKEKADLEKNIENIKASLQMGGKKRKSLKTTKKYNIRLV
jgi:hypothetical protein